MIQEVAFGWSLGALSIILFNQAYDMYASYRKDLRLSRFTFQLRMILIGLKLNQHQAQRNYSSSWKRTELQYSILKTLMNMKTTWMI